ncbi:MAG: hypothetical protein IT519_02440 [Burkholderiales bacterium]|nr:hypothetical protein [Burkholderiales bacterium]
MPTARELLEQADALMRRNRQETARAPAMPPVPPPVEVPPAIAPERTEPRIVGEPMIAPAATPRMNEDAVAGIGDADIPVLDDAVAEDEVPLLTDAVDEIEVAAPGIDEGEPSDWLEQDSGQESVLGPAPPSVVLVPPATAAARPVPGEPARPFSAAASAAPVPPPPEIEDLVSEPVDPDVTLRRETSLPALPPSLSRIEDVAEPDEADLDAVENWTGPDTVAPVADPAAAPLERQQQRIADDAGTDELPAPAFGVSSASPPQRELPVGAEREALAEEIRMQVLQRIDMFTDAGLRERLGERLKPIVDRASADLVDAINQHVGEILRAYVAEAIEREIDRWRSGRA